MGREQQIAPKRFTGPLDQIDFLASLDISGQQH
jgi:hypothetical protein